MPVSEDWIGHREIRDIDGTLRPSAYVGRAYRYEREHDGRPPEWARKKENGRWQFSREYIEADARLNSESVGTDEAARILGTTKRTIQTWCDEGVIISAGGEREKGEPRRILRTEFERDLPRLRRRLQSSTSSVGMAEASGQPDNEVSLKARKAAEIEVQLQNAREVRVQEERWEGTATDTAERIANDVFDGRISRVEAMVLFNEAAHDQGVPDEIRIRVRKGFWGK